MSVEKIYFPEELIPEVVAMIRRGLADEPNARIRRNTEMQLKNLEQYWKTNHEKDDIATDPVQVDATKPKTRPRRR